MKRKDILLTMVLTPKRFFLFFGEDFSQASKEDVVENLKRILQYSSENYSENDYEPMLFTTIKIDKDSVDKVYDRERKVAVFLSVDSFIGVDDYDLEIFEGVDVSTICGLVAAELINLIQENLEEFMKLMKKRKEMLKC
ncbi:MAG: hypothetical protein AB1465_03605 [Patescibacteria group bacterium]